MLSDLRVVYLAVLEEAAQLVGRHDRAVALGLLRGGAQVRQGDALGVLVDQGRGEVADVAGQAVLVQGGHNGLGVDDLGAGEVQDDRRRLHHGDLLGGDQALGGGDEGDVDGEDVRAPEDLVDALGALDLAGQQPDTFHPTQILADFMTIEEHVGKLNGAKLVFVGDGRNNMANSLLIGAAKMGVDFRILAPRQLHPSGDLVSLARSIAMETGAKITITDNRAEALEGADAIYTDVWVSSA